MPDKAGCEGVVPGWDGGVGELESLLGWRWRSNH
jgi:hypothetical protein